MNITIRKCQGCGYEPVIFDDDLSDKYCSHCKDLLKIIAKSGGKTR